jgi:hypothetical protein
VPDIPSSLDMSQVGGVNDTPGITSEPLTEPPQLHYPACFPQQAKAYAHSAMTGLDVVVQQLLLDEVAENFRRQPGRTVPLRLLRALAAKARSGEFTPELAFFEIARRQAGQEKHLPVKPSEVRQDERPMRSQVQANLAEIRRKLGQSGGAR